MRTELGLLHERLGTTTVYVTHDQIEAMTLGQRVAVLKPYTDKRPRTLQQVDSPSKLFEEPRNLFVAGFIGSPAMNLVTGHLESANGSVEAVFGTTRLTIDAETINSYPGLATRMNQDIVFGIRPGAFEDARIARDADAGRILEETADVVEILGSETLVHFDVAVPPVVTPDIEELLADTGADADSLGGTTRFTASISSDAAVASGQRVRLAVDTRKIYFFDPETGLRII